MEFCWSTAVGTLYQQIPSEFTPPMETRCEKWVPVYHTGVLVHVWRCDHCACNARASHTSFAHSIIWTFSVWKPLKSLWPTWIFITFSVDPVSLPSSVCDRSSFVFDAGIGTLVLLIEIGLFWLFFSDRNILESVVECEEREIVTSLAKTISCPVYWMDGQVGLFCWIPFPHRFNEFHQRNSSYDWDFSLRARARARACVCVCVCVKEWSLSQSVVEPSKQFPRVFDKLCERVRCCDQPFLRVKFWHVLISEQSVWKRHCKANSRPAHDRHRILSSHFSANSQCFILVIWSSGKTCQAPETHLDVDR